MVDGPGPEMGIQAPFCGFLDVTLDQICRTRLKNVQFLDFYPQKRNLYRFGGAILDQIRRTRLKR